jgi:hypothetical protein
MRTHFLEEGFRNVTVGDHHHRLRPRQGGARCASRPAASVSSHGASEAPFTKAFIIDHAHDFVPQIRVTDTAAVPSMLIRNGNAQIEVDSLEIAMQQVRDLAQRLGGYIANTQLASGRDQIRSATLEMKFPAARWGDAISGLKPIGKVEALNEFSQDVGEEYVDVTARVQNAKRLEARLIELLANRTGRLSDVLAVERELARVREEIERYEGRLRFLRSRVSMSSLSVTVHEPFPVVSARGESGVLGDAFKQAWRNFVGFIAGIISLTGILIPLAALGVLAWVLWRRWWRRRPPRSDTPGTTA